MPLLFFTRRKARPLFWINPPGERGGSAERVRRRREL